MGDGRCVSASCPNSWQSAQRDTRVLHSHQYEGGIIVIVQTPASHEGSTERHNASSIIATATAQEAVDGGGVGTCWLVPYSLPVGVVGS